MSTVTAPGLPEVAQASVERLVRFLESSGRATPDGTFAPDAFADLTFPHWRVQLQGGEELVAARRRFHPPEGTVRVEQVTGDASGYTVKLEERWEDGGQQWYCREAFICLLDAEGRITDFSVYCTGDWDEARVQEHAAAVRLLRP
jgi:hypothetical protein